MTTMFVKFVDHDRKIFNVVEIGSGYESFEDPRAEKLIEDQVRIVSTTQRRIEVFPFPVPDFSLERVSSKLILKGYNFNSAWCPTRRMRNEYLPAAVVKENALLVSQEKNDAFENDVTRILSGLGMEHFIYCWNSEGWDQEMYNRHIGVWEDTADGPPVLIPPPEERKIDLAIVACKLNEPDGYNVFDSVRGCFEFPMPVIVIVPPGGSSLATTVAAMRRGAETIIEQSAVWRERLESSILDTALASDRQCRQHS